VIVTVLSEGAAMETANPYASPETITVDNGQTPRLTFHHYNWGALTLVAAILWAVFPIEEFPIRRLLQSSILAWVIVMGSPAIYWEAFCRKTPRPQKWWDSLNSSLLRCWFVYFLVFLAGGFIFSTLAGQMWSNGDAPMTPAMKIMYAKHGLANASAVLLASAVVVIFDRWRSVCDTKRTEPVYGLSCQENKRVALRSFFLFLGRLHGFMLARGSILTGLRLARRNSNGGARRATVGRSVSAPNRYHGSALARSVRRWAAKTAASRKAIVRLLGGSRRAQEIHPFPRIRQFKSTVRSTSRVSS
jgi:hypothetical protein